MPTSSLIVPSLGMSSNTNARYGRRGRDPKEAIQQRLEDLDDEQREKLQEMVEGADSGC